MGRLLCLFLFSSQTILGQTSWPPVYEIKADTPVYKISNEYWQMLEDSSGLLTLDQVMLSPFAERFHTNNTEGKGGIGFVPVQYYWQRMRLCNSSGKPLKVIFENNPYANRYDLYISRPDGQKSHEFSGWNVPWSKRNGYKDNSAIPVSLTEGEEIILYKKLFVQAGRGFASELSLGITFPEHMLGRYYFERSDRFNGDIRSGFTAGLLIFGFIINLFFFLIVRERLYLYYAIFLFAEGSWYVMGLITGNWVVFREAPRMYFFLDAIVFYGVCFFFFTMFVREFLKTYKFYPRWDKFLLTMVSLVVGISISKLFYQANLPVSWKGIIRLVHSALFFLLMLSLILTFFFPKKEKRSFNKLAIAAALPTLIVWSFIYGLAELNWFLIDRYRISILDQSSWINIHYNIIEMCCVAWFAILFSWILLQRYALLRKQLTLQTLEREREQRDIMSRQKVLLEQEVEVRTAELKHSIEKLKTTQTQLIEQRLAVATEKEAKLLAEFDRKFSESELKALRSQMNPHFVFNILNTIESYALENNKEGVSAMIQKFSRLTRLVLENSMNQLVPFQNDWKSLQLYIELEQMRYADDFRVVYNIQDEVLDGEYFIPPMIIQPFVENAIIHGLRNKADHGGILNLSARLQNEFIIVEVQDNGIGRVKAAVLKGNNSIQKKSLGIKLTQDRISIFNNLRQNKKVNVEIDDLIEGTKVTIAMPANLSKSQ